jgi:hypothetical protein
MGMNLFRGKTPDEIVALIDPSNATTLPAPLRARINYNLLPKSRVVEASKLQRRE